MEFFIIIFALLFIIMVTRAAQVPKNFAIPTERHCPPHQWDWHEVKDKDGNILVHQLRCKICGPLGNRKDEN